MYQPLISNQESGDAFCLMQHEGLLKLLVFLVTVAERHPVKANGLKDIVRALNEKTRLLIARKVVVFVTNLDGKLTTVQDLESQKSKVLSALSEIRDFEQWVYRHTIAV